MKSIFICASAVAGKAAVSAFTVTSQRSPLILAKKNQIAASKTRLYEEKDGKDERTGMDDAFSSLNDLSSLDLGTPAKSSESKIKLNLGDVNVDKILTEDEGGMSQDEINLYKDMYQEIETDEGEGVYGDILGEMSTSSGEVEDKTKKESKSTSSGKGFGKNQTLDDADGIGSLNQDDNEQLTAVELGQDTDAFMKKALEEALNDAKFETPAGKSIIDESILEDEELMKEINAVFERANEKLLEGVSEIRKEQQALSEASATERDSRLEEEGIRLKEAEGSVARLVEKVNKEKMEVEKAVEELKLAQETLGEDPLFQAAGLKKAGIVRQSALVGAILFSFRAVGELLVMTQGFDVEGHGSAAAIQGLIAVACGAYLAFTKE